VRFKKLEARQANLLKFSWDGYSFLLALLSDNTAKMYSLKSFSNKTSMNCGYVK